MGLHEKKRQEEVKRYLQLDLAITSEFKEIVDFAAEICEKPISLITLLDKDTNWIRIAAGTDLTASPRTISFCQHVISGNKLLIIPDATKDKLFDDNPLVQGPPALRFYAGAPLVLSNGYHIGALCLFDQRPNTLTKVQQKTLSLLSRQVTLLMELQLTKAELLSHIEEIEKKNDSLQAISHMQSHDIRQPLTTIMGLVNLIKDGIHTVNDEWLKMLSEATNALDKRIRSIVNESMGKKDLKLLRFNKMVEEIEDYAILLLDEDGNIENWNKGAEKIKGYNASEIIGKNFTVFYTPEDQHKMLSAHLLDVAKEHDVARDEGWRVRKDGSLFWARVVISAIHDDERHIIGFTKVTRDLTNQLR